MKLLAISALAVTLVASSALAQDVVSARLSSVEGAVMVNHGSGFVPATSQTVLHAGDRVVSMKSGKVHLVYANGCSLAIGGGALATVGKTAPTNCSAASVVKDNDRTTEEGGGDYMSAKYLVPGVIVAGGIGVGIYEATKSTSP